MNSKLKDSPWKKSSPSFLPPINHVFGLANKKDDYSVGQLCSSWDVHTTSVEHKKKEYDYTRLNKMAAIANKYKYQDIMGLRNELNGSLCRRKSTHRNSKNLSPI